MNCAERVMLNRLRLLALSLHPCDAFIVLGTTFSMDRLGSVGFVALLASSIAFATTVKDLAPAGGIQLCGISNACVISVDTVGQLTNEFFSGATSDVSNNGMITATVPENSVISSAAVGAVGTGLPTSVWAFSTFFGTIATADTRRGTSVLSY